jgi:hypothetical protein
MKDNDTHNIVDIVAAASDQGFHLVKSPHLQPHPTTAKRGKAARI